MSDAETLKVYAKRAKDYADRFGGAKSAEKHLRSFLDGLPPGARILDLGCGPGHAAAAMRAEGFEVEAWDASPEMAQVGRDIHDLDIRVATFDALEGSALYDGIYANFSLLHAPKTEMPNYLARISQALKPSGLFHIGLKTGAGEKRDAIGRFYAYYTDDELTKLLAVAGLNVETRATGEERGLDGTLAPWIIMKARKNG